jgi:hypothetical protein
MPRVHTLIAEIGTSRVMERFEIGWSAGTDLARAVDLEHHCDDSACDIHAALSADCPYTAAALLEGATETPLLDAVAAYWGVFLDDLMGQPDWGEWLAHHADFGHECSSCGSFTYGDEWWTPGECGCCGAALPADDNDC